MNTCFECGGKLKLIAKPGRMVWNEDELFEIPAELKISACGECGQPLEDAFLKAKLEKSIAAQKAQKPSARLLQLRWIHKFLENLYKRPRMYALGLDSIFCQTLLLLEFREVILLKGQVEPNRQIGDALHAFLQKRYPHLGSHAFPDPETVDMESEFAPVLREFCDVWINATN